MRASVTKIRWGEITDSIPPERIQPHSPTLRFVLHFASYHIIARRGQRRALLRQLARQRPSTMTGPPADYTFPRERLLSKMRNPDKQPVVLVACGSFSPVTYLHLRMFEMASDYVRQNTDFEIMGGYLSPVSDMYKKPGLLSATHR